MLNDFLYYLDQTDVSMIAWAQYMPPVTDDGPALITFEGNARPGWHSFKFWADLPVERVVCSSASIPISTIDAIGPPQATPLKSII